MYYSTLATTNTYRILTHVFQRPESRKLIKGTCKCTWYIPNSTMRQTILANQVAPRQIKFVSTHYNLPTFVLDYGPLTLVYDPEERNKDKRERHKNCTVTKIGAHNGRGLWP